MDEGLPAPIHNGGCGFWLVGGSTRMSLNVQKRPLCARENLAQANKLSRTYATLLEALNRHRGKGQQKVTVEHVHVHAGGQAEICLADSGRARPRAGDGSNLEEQPHAKQI